MPTKTDPSGCGIQTIRATHAAFSKKLANPKASVALHYAHYNLRIHRTVRVSRAAGVMDRLWSMDELIGTAVE